MINLIESARYQPVTMDEAKKYLKIEHSEEDDTLMLLIKAATRWVEHYLNRSLMSQRWQVIWQKDQVSKPTTLSLEFEDYIRIPLPFPPLIQVESVSFMLSNYTRKETRRYVLDVNGGLPEVVLASSAERVEVVYQSGYGERPADVPDDIRQGVLVKLSDLYHHRYDKEVPASGIVNSLLQPYRVMRLVA